MRIPFHRPPSSILPFLCSQKTGNKFRYSLLFALLGHGLSQAGVIISGTMPNTSIISESSSFGSTFSNLFPLTGTTPGTIPGNNNHVRGQLFSLSDGSGTGYEISTVTFQKNNPATYINDSLTLHVFQGNSAAWTSGTGHTATDTSFYLGTSVTPLYEEVFTLNGLIGNNDYITLELATPLIVAENSDFGFFLTYDPATASSPDAVRYLESSNGGRISIDHDSHDNSSRMMNYLIQGTPTSASTIPLTLGSPFQNRMILQRDKPVKIWGTSDTNSTIEITIDGNTVTITVDFTTAFIHTGTSRGRGTLISRI